MSRTPISLVAAIVLAACAESSVVEPGAPGGEAGARAGLAASPSRPAGGTCTLVGRTILPPESEHRRQTDWVCQLKHLGRTTASFVETVTVTPTGLTVTGTGTFTAANGDQLSVTYTGTVTPPDRNGVVTFGGTYTVTGGTGRLAGASGSLARTGSVSVVILTGEFEISGTLSY